MKKHSDYKRLLTEVLPVHKLDEKIQTLVRESVLGENPIDLWKATRLVMDALCAKGLFERSGQNGQTATYHSRESLLSISIEPPARRSPGYEFPSMPVLAPEIASRGGSKSLESLFTGVATRLSDDELGSSLKEIIEYLKEVLSPDAVHVIIYDTAGASALDSGVPTDFAEQLRNQFESGGDGVYIPDLSLEPGVSRLLRASGTASIAILPLRAESEVFGALEVLHREVNPFGEKELGILSLLALLAAGRIRNARRLEKLIYIDLLTGVFSRRFFEEQVLREVERANRDRLPLALVMVDLDNFKDINDNYGHTIGDRVLSAVGQLLNENVRKIDLVTRYGGEEFALLLPGASHDQSEMICERLRSLVENLPLRTDDDEKLHLTASIGIAIYPEHTPEGEDLQAIRKDLLEKADQALYQAKEAGKNLVIFWQNPDAL